MNSNQNIHTTAQSELDALRRQVAKLEKRCVTLEEQRDEARLAVVAQAVKKVIDDGLWSYKGHYIPSESIRRILLGQMTLEAAIADRNVRWPIFADETTLEQCYRMVA